MDTNSNVMHAHQGGFTYIETLVVVGILSIVLSFGMVIGVESIGKTSVLEERDLFVSLVLTGARARAMANNEQTAHGVYIDNVHHAYILFIGNAFVQGAPSNRTIPFTNKHISVSNTGGDTIVFSQLSGNVGQGAGTITMYGNNTSQHIHLNSIGGINW